MWTKEHRAKAVARTKELKRYPSDLTDDEWSVIAPLMPAASRIGRPRGVDLREVINAIRRLVRSGCEWRMLPRDFPPWQTVYWWFRRFVRRLLFRVIHDIALMMDRQLHSETGSQVLACWTAKQSSRPQQSSAAMTPTRRSLAANAISLSIPMADC